LLYSYLKGCFYWNPSIRATCKIRPFFWPPKVALFEGFYCIVTFSYFTPYCSIIIKIKLFYGYAFLTVKALKNPSWLFTTISLFFQSLLNLPIGILKFCHEIKILYPFQNVVKSSLAVGGWGLSLSNICYYVQKYIASLRLNQNKTCSRF